MRIFKATLISASLIALTGCFSGFSSADELETAIQSSAKDQLSAIDLMGVWDVSLFFSPTAAPSATTMEVLSVNDDGTLTGTFYDTPFETARYTEREGQIAFSVITRDGSGIYATSGRLSQSGLIEGQTLATGREFIMMWAAKPQTE